MRWCHRIAWAVLLTALTLASLPFVAYDDARAVLRGEL